MSHAFSKAEPTPPPPLPVDPNLAQEQADAAARKTSTLQDQLRGDSASIMARYGTNLALAGTLPGVAAAPAVAPSPGQTFDFSGVPFGQDFMTTALRANGVKV